MMAIYFLYLSRLNGSTWQFFPKFILDFWIVCAQLDAKAVIKIGSLRDNDKID